VPQVKIKIQNILTQSKTEKSTGFEVVFASANEGESILELFRRLAQENRGLSKIVSYATGQDEQIPTAIILNGRFLSPLELSEVTLKEGDELTVLPLLDGG
jgi:hypothetical protein